MYIGSFQKFTPTAFVEVGHDNIVTVELVSCYQT